MKKSLTGILGLAAVGLFCLLALSACDPLALSAPSNFKASLSGNTVTLTWGAVSGATRYHIFEKLEGTITTSGSFVELVYNPTSSPCVFTVSSTTGITYTFQICAENENTGYYSDRATSNSVTH
jgi:hypothetical protein